MPTYRKIKSIILSFLNKTSTLCCTGGLCFSSISMSFSMDMEANEASSVGSYLSCNGPSYFTTFQCPKYWKGWKGWKWKDVQQFIVEMGGCPPSSSCFKATKAQLVSTLLLSEDRKLRHTQARSSNATEIAYCDGSRIPLETLGNCGGQRNIEFLLHSETDLLSAPSNKIWSRESNPSCNQCGAASCTLNHILNGWSKALEEGHNRWRHGKSTHGRKSSNWKLPTCRSNC